MKRGGAQITGRIALSLLVFCLISGGFRLGAQHAPAATSDTLPAYQQSPSAGIPDSFPAPSAEQDRVSQGLKARNSRNSLFLDPDSVRMTLELDNPLALQYNGIYLSGRSAAIPEKVEELIDSLRGTPIGGVVVDLKDDQGRLSYTSRLPLAAEIGANSRRLKDPAALVAKLHHNGLIACARLVSFKDPRLAGFAGADSSFPYAVLDSTTNRPWRQDNGETWANPYDEMVHAYLLGLAAELVEFGFDQIQLDYLRFPSDGPVENCYYPAVIDSLNRAEVLGLFLAKIRRLLDGSGVSLAVDVFGWIPWLDKERSYWIGQDYDLIARYADVICPMLYSSHFPRDFKAEYAGKRAYEIIREGTLKGAFRSGCRPTAVQPYIQGFRYRSPYYGSQYILDQMQAALESGAVGWIVWNAANDYASLWRALKR